MTLALSDLQVAQKSLSKCLRKLCRPMLSDSVKFSQFYKALTNNPPTGAGREVLLRLFRRRSVGFLAFWKAAITRGHSNSLLQSWGMDVETT